MSTDRPDALPVIAECVEIDCNLLRDIRAQVPKEWRPTIDGVLNGKTKRDAELSELSELRQQRRVLSVEANKLANDNLDLRNERDTLQAELAAMRENVTYVHDTFAQDLAQGYRTKDKVFAIDILKLSLKKPPLLLAPSQVAAEVVQVPREWLDCLIGEVSHGWGEGFAESSIADEIRALLATSQGEA